MDSIYIYTCLPSQDSDANLASSTVRRDQSDNLGIIVTYSVQVELECGAISGTLVASLPFKLMHPAPGETLPSYSFIFISNPSSISW